MRIEKVKLFLLIFGLIFITTTVHADSPLTSTPFSNAYSDIQMVSAAKTAGQMNPQIAAYLHGSSVSIDKKAAVINALGWDHVGTSNSISYCNFVYGKTVGEDEINSLSASELFVIGYLNAMDAYMNPDGALPFLKQARFLLSNSYTVNIIYGLVKSQKAFEGDFCKAWKHVNKVFMNSSLDMDMREDARKIIYDYMVLYKGKCK